MLALARTKACETAFFPYCINKQKKLKDKIRNAESINNFKTAIIDLIKPKTRIKNLRSRCRSGALG